MNSRLCFASVFGILLSIATLEMAQDLTLKFGLRRFNFFSRSANNFDEARLHCENHGWQLAHIRNRTIALRLQDFLAYDPGKPK